MAKQIQPRYQVFISSTYEDLKEERSSIIGVLLKNNFIPVGMEQFTAGPKKQWEYCREMIDCSDYYLLIVGGRYGSIDSETGLSFTEREFRYAKDHDIPIIAILHKHPEKLSVEKSEKTDEGREKIKAFREYVEDSGITVDYYENAEELSSVVVSAVHNTKEECPRPGWVRADQARSIAQDYVDKSGLGRLEEMIQELRNEMNNALTWEEITDDEIDALFEKDTEEAHNNVKEEEEQLSKDAQVLLIYAADNNYGEIIISRSLSGGSVSAGQWNFVDEDGGTREEARWQGAVDELEGNGLIKAASYRRQVFSVTREGFAKADELNERWGIDRKKNPDEYLG